MAIPLIYERIFKDGVDRYLCPKCGRLLDDPVQLGCGHRLCRLCADEVIATDLTAPECPECKEAIEEEDEAKVSH